MKDGQNNWLADRGQFIEKSPTSVDLKINSIMIPTGQNSIVTMVEVLTTLTKSKLPISKNLTKNPEIGSMIHLAIQMNKY